MAVELEVLLEEAKEELVAYGEVQPRVIIQRQKSVSDYIVDKLSDTYSVPDQCGILARSAWEEGGKYPKECACSIAFISCTWQLTESPHTYREQFYPSHSPKKREVLLVERWERSTPPKEERIAVPLTRDRRERLISIGKPEYQPHTSVLLQALVRGAEDALKTKEDAIRDLEQHIHENVATFSPEKQRQIKYMLKQAGIPKHILNKLFS